MVDPSDPPFWRDIVSLVAVYAWFLGALVWGRRWRRRRTQNPERHDTVPWAKLTHRVVETFVGGFLLFTVIMGVYHLLLTGRPWEAVFQVVAANAALVFGVILPCFLALAWVRRRIATRARVGPQRARTERVLAAGQADSRRSAASRAASAMRST